MWRFGGTASALSYRQIPRTVFSRSMLSRLALIVALVATPLVAHGRGLVRDEFEGPEPSLRDAGGDATYKTQIHRRTSLGVHTGTGCEQLQLVGNNGTYVYFTHSIAPARVISELAPSVWIKADRPGIQLLLRIVLPRSSDSDGKPITTLLRVADYRQAGVWQQLRADDLPKMLDRHVRVLRAQHGPQVDPREAYVDTILLNVYGGPGTTTVWVDDLEVAGVVTPSTAAPGAASEVVQASAEEPAYSPAARASAWPGGRGTPRVEFKGRLLLVDGKPFFPRSIDYRGEALSRLQALGFNAVRVARTPGPEMLRDAAAIGLWLIAPPPPAEQLDARSGRPVVTIDSSYDPVLVWDLGTGLATRELAATRHWAELVKSADPRDRPLLCDADSDLQSYTRTVDILVARRDPIGSTLTLEQYGNWLRERARLARGGTPLWATIQTEYSARLTQQMQLLAGDQLPSVGIEEMQLRMVIHTAIAAKARGLCFASQGSLDAPDPASRRRAALLELVNLQLDLIERWPAAGSFAPVASSNNAQTTGAIVESDRSRLLLPVHAPPEAQLLFSNPRVKDLSFLVPGVPEGNNAYELSPTNFRPLTAKRIAGGTLVTLAESERESVVVFTQDALVTKTLNERLGRIRKRAAQLTRDLAQADLAELDATEQRLAAVGRTIPSSPKARAAAAAELAQCDEALPSGTPSDLSKAYYLARHAQQTLRDVRQAHWNVAMQSSPWPLSDPLLTTFGTLGDHYRFQHELTSAPRGPNRLAEGGFESFAAMRAAGWKYYEHAQPNIATSVHLLPEAAHGGRLGLRLRAEARDAENRPAVVETAPMWITSPSVMVQQGELVQIQGWLRVAQPIVGSVDGLLIIDTLSGEALAGRVSRGAEWRQFTVYRAAGRPGPMAITFALAGMGEVWIDDVTIQTVGRAAAATSPPGMAARER